MVPDCDRYVEAKEGQPVYQQDTELDLASLLEGAVPLKVTGIIQPKAEAKNPFITEPIVYTSLLTDSIIEYTNESPVTALHVDREAPTSISIYTDSFEDKDAVTQCIADYNAAVSSDKQITYTDYVKLMTSSLTSIVDVISYVLIAFVGVSLIVSCVMIGIITHISVLERTKEIGILRALGASKRNISQVFNAETMIIGCCAGLLGVGVSLALTVPINALIQKYLDAENLVTSIPLTAIIILIAISIVITWIGGLIPAHKAAKKDPVIALRTE
jgi:putative ABC transport system permease protein